MPLDVVCAELESELDSLSQHCRDFAAVKPVLDAASHFSFLDECLLEGLLSRVWQAWNRFCRKCVIESCMGTKGATGLNITGLPDAISEQHVSSAAIQAKKESKPYWGAQNSILRYEPTWGDVDVLARILPRLHPTNFTKLLAAFSAGYPSAKALQVIRNGAAHDNVQTRNDIDALRSTFLVFPIGHPTHAMFWVEPTSKDFLITHVIDELKDSGRIAIV
jgi:hypothetical protein